VATQFLKGDGTWGTPVAPPVTSVAGRTGDVTLTTADVSGLGSAAALASSAVLQASNNLSDLASASTARANIGAAAKGANTDITSITLTGSGTALTVTNGASIGGNLSVTGAITGNVSGGVRQTSSQLAATTAGSVTAYTLTNSPAIAAGPVAGTRVIFKVNATNTGAATLNVDGTGAKSLVSMRTGASVASGDLVASKYITATYDGTNWLADIPNLYFSQSALSCGSTIVSGSSVTCSNIAATNVNAGDVVQCSPSADPASAAGKVQWSALATAGNISIRLGCSNGGTSCSLTSVNWKCLVMK